MKVTKISNRGIDLIKSFEGLHLEPYYDPVGIPTIGYGTIRYPNGRRVSMSDKPITQAQAVEYLRHFCKQFELAVDAIIRDDITQNQFDALVSFTYNVGETNFRSSTLARKINANPKDPSIAKEFAKWVYANRRILKGLVRRRKAESDFYFS